MSRRALLLVDGEHYPPVIEAGLRRLRTEGLLPVAALFLGGFEKTGAAPRLSIPVRTGGSTELPGLIRDLGVEVVVDLSDDPVVDPRTRFALVSACLAAGAGYLGGGFAFEAPPRPRLSRVPTVAVIGTGKRAGKTALAIELARWWRQAGMRPCIVTMGRGGPPEPLVIRAAEVGDPVALLERLAADGLHATSDYVEDAVFAAVDAVGTRRLGAGPAGVPVDDTFAAGIGEAERLGADLLVLEGSGTAIPPAHADSTVLVASSRIDPELLTGYLGAYRLAIASAVVAVGEDPSPVAGAVAAAAPRLPVLPARLVPEPSVPVSGRDVLVVTTARPEAAGKLERALIDQGARAVRVVTSLSDRRALAADMAPISRDLLVLTEVKAAAAAVVIPAARVAGAEIALLHNRVEVEGGLEALLEHADPRPARPVQPVANAVIGGSVGPVTCQVSPMSADT